MPLFKCITHIGYVITVATLLITNVNAHERFVVPSHTLLSGDTAVGEKAQSVTLTASISNAIFHPDRPFGDSGTGADVGDLKSFFARLKYAVIDPTGEISLDTRWQAFARMSVADVKLTKSGTYRVGLNQPELPMTTFKKADGTPARLFGAEPKIPADATDIVRRATSSRVETFITLNSPSDNAVKPRGNGVELAGETHPNDLFSGEQANFQLLYNGKPMTVPAKVKMIKAGTRHRNNRQEQLLSVDKDGKFIFLPTESGFYFLSAEVAIQVPQPAIYDVKHFSLYLTLEVFPE